MIAQVLEALMMVCFGVSWPLSIYKSYQARTTKGKSNIFLYFILIGYGIGIANKIISNTITYVLVFYVTNFLLVFIDLCLYYRNKRIDKINEQIKII